VHHYYGSELKTELLITVPPNKWGVSNDEVSRCLIPVNYLGLLYFTLLNKPLGGEMMRMLMVPFRSMEPNDHHPPGR
jgi:hypothetical protein